MYAPPSSPVALTQEVYEEFSNFGHLEDLHVVDNLGDHLVGNVYAKFYDEEDAEKCKTGLFGRLYAGRPMMAEFCPVTDFREGRSVIHHTHACNAQQSLRLFSSKYPIYQCHTITHLPRQRGICHTSSPALKSRVCAFMCAYVCVCVCVCASMRVVYN